MKIEKKKRGCRKITGSMLENSFQNSAGAQIVRHGAPAPGKFKYCELIASKLIAQNCFV